MESSTLFFRKINSSFIRDPITAGDNNSSFHWPELPFTKCVQHVSKITVQQKCTSSRMRGLSFTHGPNQIRLD